MPTHTHILGKNLVVKVVAILTIFLHLQHEQKVATRAAATINAALQPSRFRGDFALVAAHKFRSDDIWAFFTTACCLMPYVPYIGIY